MATISVHKLHQFLFALCVLILVLNNYELTFAVWFLTALVTSRRQYSVRIIKLLLIPTAILLIAFVSAFVSDNKSYNYFRDVAYLLKPILGLLIGYNICKSVGKKILYPIIYTGLALSVIHIITLGVCYSIFHIRNVHELRHYGGYFNDFEIYVLILLVFRKRFDIELSTQKTVLFALVIGFSTFLYFARTNIIQLIVLFLAMQGYFKITKRSIVVLLVSFTVIGGLYAAIYQSNPQRGAKGIEAFLYKVKIAPIESFKTRINKDDWKDFNDNYRSFENIMTVRQMTQQDTFVMLIGEGLGSTIDIGREVWSNDGEMIRYIPILHNAYMTIFLKSGLIGVFFLLLFIYVLFRNGGSGGTPQLRNVNYLIIGSAIYLIISNWIFMGLYLKLDNKSIFLGFLICYKEWLLREHRLTKKVWNEQ